MEYKWKTYKEVKQIALSFCKGLINLNRFEILDQFLNKMVIKCIQDKEENG